MKTPSIFRYRSISTNSLSELANSTIWCSSVDKFNDPFEFQFVLNSLEHTEENKEFVISTIQSVTCKGRAEIESEVDSYQWEEFGEAVEKSKQDLLDLIRTKGVCCFSKRKDSLLMWGHYAMGHTGYLVEYDTTIAPFSSVVPVQYSVKLPKFSIQELFHQMGDCVFQIVTRKGPEWSYEEEYRLIRQRDNSNLSLEFEPAGIKAIYFGVKCSEENRKIIRRLTSHLDLEYFSAEIDPNSHKISFAAA